jgi:hypothetical protein
MDVTWDRGGNGARWGSLTFANPTLQVSCNQSASTLAVCAAPLLYNACYCGGQGYSWPVFEATGSRPGPRLCVTAGIHVNEVSASEPDSSLLLARSGDD